MSRIFQNRVIATVVKSRLLATKRATYLVTKANSCGVIAISVHSFLSTAIAISVHCFLSTANAKIRENVD